MSAKAQKLVKLAISVAKMREAAETAYQCGDDDYLIDSLLERDYLQDQLRELKESCSNDEIKEAREITNAPI